MININFFEKKKTNILPYLVAGIFVLMLILMAIYFFFARMYFSDTVSDNNGWIEAETEEVVLSRQMNQLDQQYNEAIELQEGLKQNQYPMNKVTEEIAASVPDEAKRISSFQLEDSSQLTLVLENTKASVGLSIVEEIETLPYVTGVQFLHADNEGEKDKELRFELIVDLDESLMTEEEVE